MNPTPNTATPTSVELAELRETVFRLQRTQRRTARLAVVLLVAGVATFALVAQDRHAQPVAAPSFIVQRADGSTAAVLGPNGLSLSADGRTTQTELTPGRISLADATGREGASLQVNATGSSLDVRTPGSLPTAPTGRIDAQATTDGRASLRVTHRGQESFAAGNPPPARQGADAPSEDPRWAEARMLSATLRDAMIAWRTARGGKLSGLVASGQGFSLVDARERLGISLTTLAALRFFSSVDFTIWIDSVENGTFRIVVRGSHRDSPTGTLTVWPDGRTDLSGLHDRRPDGSGGNGSGGSGG
ncbi:MAG: hypothetical protein AB7K09_16785 [Planctomycetota bacterium]